MKFILAFIFSAMSTAALADPLFSVTYRYPDSCQLTPFKGLAMSNERRGESVLGYNIIQGGAVLQKYRGTLADGSNQINQGSKYGHIRIDLEYVKSEPVNGVQSMTINGIKTREAYKPFDLFGSLYEVKDFAPTEAIEYLSNAVRLECQVEIDSEFNVDSVRANFARLVKPFDSTVVYKTRSPITTINVNPEWRRFQGASSYVMLVDETPALLFPQFAPYRNGTKVMTKILLPANPREAGNLDFTHAVATLNAEIAKVINN